MEQVHYDARLHRVYAAGRRMSPDAQDVWMRAFSRHLPARRPLRWLDLGSGTGRMSPALAEAFGGPVVGVEPSDKMRDQAVAGARHPAVRYVAGSAERIPLPEQSCDAALVFFVWHHVGDREVAARELRRVVKPGGRLFLQANFSDDMPDTWWFRLLPEWKRIDASQFPTEAQVKRDFADAGWRLIAHDPVRWVRSASLSEDVDKLRLRAVSLFEHMTEAEVHAGFERIEATLPSIAEGPQFETSQLLAFEP